MKRRNKYGIDYKEQNLEPAPKKQVKRRTKVEIAQDEKKTQQLLVEAGRIIKGVRRTSKQIKEDKKIGRQLLAAYKAKVV